VYFECKIYVYSDALLSCADINSVSLSCLVASARTWLFCFLTLIICRFLSFLLLSADVVIGKAA